MTTEEKARAYDEALERAKNALRTDLHESGVRAIQRIFPQLAESEDERIRKALIKLMTVAGESYVMSATGFEKERLLAYLEKQKENIEKEYVFRPLAGTDINTAVLQAIRRANEGDRLVLAFNGAYIPVRKGVDANKIVDIYDAFVEKQKEQKSESCEPDTNVEKVIEDVIRVYGKTQGEWVGGYDVDTLIVNLRRAFNKKEQHPSSQFRPGDWVVYDGPLGHAILQIKDVVDGRYTFVDNESTLLVEDSDKFLRPLTPKDVEKKAEWSDENYDIISNISNQVYKAIRRTLASLAVYDEDEELLESKEATLSYYSQQCAEAILKFLRPSWKPSKEQMEVLLSTQDIIRASGYRQNAKVLVSLYEQLKRLM